MDKLQIADIERLIVYRLVDSALWKTDEEWAEIVKEAQKLMDSNVAVNRFTDANLYRCIAYCAAEIKDTDTRDRAGAIHQGEMYGSFWFFVAELARRRMVGR